MKTKKYVVCDKDYELYKFFLPKEVLFGRNRKRFIENELGKRHPCYSDDFCFENFIVISKKGFEAKVVVMEKNKVSELKTEEKGKRLYIKPLKHFVFETGVFGVWKKIKGTVILGIIICLICSLYLYFFKKNISNESVIEEKEQNNAFIQEESVRNRIDVNNFFKIVENNNGYINWFEWRYEETLEELASSVLFVYPEKFIEAEDELKVSAVSYIDKKPSMIVTEKKHYKTFANQNRNELNNLFYVSLLRKILEANNAIIIEENFSPYSLSFSFNNTEKNKNEKNLISKIAEFARENELIISYLYIKNTENNNFDVRLAFANKKIEGIDLEIIGKFLKLMVVNQNKDKNLQVVKEKIPKKEKSIGTKMGEVIHADGKKVEFYKTQEGKIKIQQ